MHPQHVAVMDNVWGTPLSVYNVSTCSQFSGVQTACRHVCMYVISWEVCSQIGNKFLNSTL